MLHHISTQNARKQKTKRKLSKPLHRPVRRLTIVPHPVQSTLLPTHHQIFSIQIEHLRDSQPAPIHRSSQRSFAASTPNTSHQQPPQHTFSKSFNKFVLSIHPDFFQAFPEEQQQNSLALGLLNNVMSDAKSNSLQAQTINLTFFLKPSSVQVETASSQPEANTTSVQFKPAQKTKGGKEKESESKLKRISYALHVPTITSHHGGLPEHIFKPNPMHGPDSVPNEPKVKAGEQAEPKRFQRKKKAAPAAPISSSLPKAFPSHEHDQLAGELFHLFRTAGVEVDTFSPDRYETLFGFESLRPNFESGSGKVPTLSSQSAEGEYYDNEGRPISSRMYDLTKGTGYVQTMHLQKGYNPIVEQFTPSTKNPKTDEYTYTSGAFGFKGKFVDRDDAGHIATYMIDVFNQNERHKRNQQFPQNLSLIEFVSTARTHARHSAMGTRITPRTIVLESQLRHRGFKLTFQKLQTPVDLDPRNEAHSTGLETFVEALRYVPEFSHLTTPSLWKENMAHLANTDEELNSLKQQTKQQPKPSMKPNGTPQGGANAQFNKHDGQKVDCAPRYGNHSDNVVETEQMERRRVEKADLKRRIEEYQREHNLDPDQGHKVKDELHNLYQSLQQLYDPKKARNQTESTQFSQYFHQVAPNSARSQRLQQPELGEVQGPEAAYPSHFRTPKLRQLEPKFEGKPFDLRDLGPDIEKDPVTSEVTMYNPFIRRRPTRPKTAFEIMMEEFNRVEYNQMTFRGYVNHQHSKYSFVAKPPSLKLPKRTNKPQMSEARLNPQIPLSRKLQKEAYLEHQRQLLLTGAVDADGNQFQKTDKTPQPPIDPETAHIERFIARHNALLPQEEEKPWYASSNAHHFAQSEMSLVQNEDIVQESPITPPQLQSEQRPILPQIDFAPASSSKLNKPQKRQRAESGAESSKGNTENALLTSFIDLETPPSNTPLSDSPEISTHSAHKAEETTDEIRQPAQQELDHPNPQQSEPTYPTPLETTLSTIKSHISSIFPDPREEIRQANRPYYAEMQKQIKVQDEETIASMWPLQRKGYEADIEAAELLSGGSLQFGTHYDRPESVLSGIEVESDQPKAANVTEVDPSSEPEQPFEFIYRFGKLHKLNHHGIPVESDAGARKKQKSQKTLANIDNARQSGTELALSHRKGGNDTSLAEFDQDMHERPQFPDELLVLAQRDLYRLRDGQDALFPDNPALKYQQSIDRKLTTHQKQREAVIPRNPFEYNEHGEEYAQNTTYQKYGKQVIGAELAERIYHTNNQMFGIHSPGPEYAEHVPLKPWKGYQSMSDMPLQFQPLFSLADLQTQTPEDLELEQAKAKKAREEETKAHHAYFSRIIQKLRENEVDEFGELVYKDPIKSLKRDQYGEILPDQPLPETTLFDFVFVFDETSDVAHVDSRGRLVLPLHISRPVDADGNIIAEEDLQQDDGPSTRIEAEIESSDKTTKKTSVGTRRELARWQDWASFLQDPDTLKMAQLTQIQSRFDVEDVDAFLAEFTNIYHAYPEESLDLDLFKAFMTNLRANYWIIAEPINRLTREFKTNKLLTFRVHNHCYTHLEIQRNTVTIPPPIAENTTPRDSYRYYSVNQDDSSHDVQNETTSDRNYFLPARHPIPRQIPSIDYENLIARWDELVAEVGPDLERTRHEIDYKQVFKETHDDVVFNNYKKCFASGTYCNPLEHSNELTDAELLAQFGPRSPVSRYYNIKINEAENDPTLHPTMRPVQAAKFRDEYLQKLSKLEDQQEQWENRHEKAAERRRQEFDDVHNAEGISHILTRPRNGIPAAVHGYPDRRGIYEPTVDHNSQYIWADPDVGVIYVPWDVNITALGDFLNTYAYIALKQQQDYFDFNSKYEAKLKEVKNNLKLRRLVREPGVNIEAMMDCLERLNNSRFVYGKVFDGNSLKIGFEYRFENGWMTIPHDWM